MQQHLIPALQEAFAQNKVQVPPRHHHDILAKNGVENTLLLMPAWVQDQTIGIKVVTVHPNNGQIGLPAIQGSYLYLDAANGLPLAIMDAKSLTTKRTAATSALASKLLSRPDSSTMLMIGTGALAPELIKAHRTVRPIKQVYIWGRNYPKAQDLATGLVLDQLNIQAVSSIESWIPKVDIISCATLSTTPLVRGEYLKAGQHIDLVGAYKPNMREADDVAIQRSRVFLDSFEAGVRESGDIVQPLREGIIQISDIQSDLFGLCSGKQPGRQSSEEITFFKSVGHALEDWVAASILWKKYHP